MSQEPEKEIEKQLREHAEQRRAEADAKLGAGMHPATRKLLHGEITRTYGAAATEQKASKPWWSYWPGLVFAGGLAAVLLLVFVNESTKAKLGSSQLAKIDALAPALSPPPAAPAAPAAAATPPPSTTERSLSLSSANTEARKDLAAAEPQAAPQSMKVPNPEPVAKLGGAVSRENLANGGAAPAPNKPLDRMEVAKAVDAKAQLKVYANRSRQFEQAESRPTSDVAKQSMDRDADGAVAMKDSALRPTGGAMPASPPPAPVTSAPALSKAMAERESLVSSDTINKPMAPAKRAATSAPAPQSVSALAKADTYSVQGAVAMKQNHPVPAPVSGGVYFENKLVSAEEKNEAPIPVAPGQPALRRNFQSPPRPAVLTQFQVEQNGNEVRFIDQDGSIYVGQMLAATDEASSLADAKKEADKKEVVKTKAAEAQYYIQGAQRTGGVGGGGGQNPQSFRASGLNITLNQNVIISGEFLNQPALAGKKQSPTNYSKSMAAPAEKSKAVVPTPTQIQGRVQIGERQEIILNAVPVVK